LLFELTFRLATFGRDPLGLGLLGIEIGLRLERLGLRPIRLRRVDPIVLDLERIISLLVELLGVELILERLLLIQNVQPFLVLELLRIQPIRLLFLNYLLVIQLIDLLLIRQLLRLEPLVLCDLGLGLLGFNLVVGTLGSQTLGLRLGVCLRDLLLLDSVLLQLGLFGPHPIELLDTVDRLGDGR
jgi:hypothetical protein